MDYQYILIDVKDRIATVTINRPEYSNAFARESYYEIADAMNTLGARDDVGVIVITGAGKHFSAGGDIKRFKMLVDTKTYLKAEDIEAVSAMPISIRNCPKPVIAMINGVATGAGLSCALVFLPRPLYHKENVKKPLFSMFLLKYISPASRFICKSQLFHSHQIWHMLITYSSHTHPEDN